PGAGRRVIAAALFAGRAAAEPRKDDISDAAAKARLVGSNALRFRDELRPRQRRPPAFEGFGECDEHSLADHALVLVARRRGVDRGRVVLAGAADADR